MRIEKISEITSVNRTPFHHSRELERKGGGKKICANCQDKPAVFHVRNRRTGSIVVKTDKDHNYCPRCWNSMVDKSQSRRSYKKNTFPLMLKGDPIYYNKMGRIVQYERIKENYDERY